MNLVLQPWHLMVMYLASWINCQQQDVIEYLRTENQVLKENLVRNESCSTMIKGDDWP